MFFELVERCTPFNTTCIQVAKERVSSELAVLIHNKQHILNTWDDFQTFLHIEFAVEVNVDRGWQELKNLKYDWTETSQSSTNKFICHHESLVTRFLREKFPDRDKTIKRKLWKGMPKMSKEKLEGFLEEHYPLHKFTDRLEHERLYLEASNGPKIWRILAEKEQKSEQTSHRQNTRAST